MTRPRRWTDDRRRPTRGSLKPLDEVLVRHSTYANTQRLKLRLAREGLLVWRCTQCSLEQWKGAPMPLALDHVNGDRRDNRLDNLRLLCPNCHALTETWCGLNIGRYDAPRTAD